MRITGAVVKLVLMVALSAMIYSGQRATGWPAMWVVVAFACISIGAAGLLVIGAILSALEGKG